MKNHTATRGRRRRDQQACPPLTRQARQARALAQRHGLFLLVEASRTGPRWIFYCRSTGREVASYWPKSGFWLAGPDEGRSRDWGAVLRIAARRRDFLAARAAGGGTP